MPKLKKTALITSLLLFSMLACRRQQPTPEKGALSAVYATALREAPGEKSPELRPIQPGERLIDLGERSRFLSGIYLNDTLRQEPWIKIQATNGQQGWIFAGAIRPAGADGVATRQWTLNNRFSAYFGPVMAKRWQAWIQTPECRSDTALSVYLRTGLALRDTLNTMIARSVTRDADHPLPDLFWLAEMSPLFVVQQIAGGSTYYLFLDYRRLAQIAARTSGGQDDHFARTGLKAYPTDSIESALPAWVFPLNAEESCSNLGQGAHLDALRAVDQAWQSGDLFQPELMALKDLILDDILDKNRAYWQPKGKILSELDKILATRLHCLSGRDRLALEARRKMFEAPEENGVRVNVRSGE